MTDFKPERFVDAVRKVVQTLRYGPRELILATFGLLLLGLPSVLPKEPEAFFKPVLTWIPWVGVLLLVLAALLIWRKVVAPVPEGKPKPPAIKGPAPFDPNDAELFTRLGRKDDLDRLRAWILDDQKPLLALMGESGVGKTSLLRAGLENHLKGDAVQVIYWEALPSDPEEGLLHAVQARWGDPTTVPSSFARLPSAVARGKRVVVIDQAEQLSPDRHPGIFEMLRQVATANPPYTATWVVAFRRDYLPVWRDFELGLPESAQRRLETLSLRRFLPDQAESVIAVLAEEGGIPIEQKVVKALVESIQINGRIAPTDIGISLLALSEISGVNKDSVFTLGDFKDRGGQAGLLERYLESLLKDFPEAERREIFQALLSLIDLDHDQRLAEGRTPTQLENTARPANPTRFFSVLKFLASGKARILEEVPEPPLRYRLVHELLILAVRQLTGVLLAEAEQAGLLLERTYRTWSRDRKARYLLSGRELRHVLRFRDQLAWGDEEDLKREYLNLARQHRNRRWTAAVVILTVLGLGIYFFSEYRSRVSAERALLASWKLPEDLFDHLDQIEQLTLPKGVTRFDWLRMARQLRALEIDETNLVGLEGLPEGLRALKVGLSESVKLPQMPSSLVSLEITDQPPSSLGNLPPHLSELGFNCDFDFLDKVRLPNSLEKLTVHIDFIPVFMLNIDLTYLNNLKSFSIYSNEEAAINLDLPPQVLSVEVDSGLSLADLKNLPFGLKYLRYSGNFVPELLPRSLKHLELWYPPSELKITGLPLHTLGLFYVDLPPQLPLPSSLSTLVLKVGADHPTLPQLPPNLNTLSLDGDSINPQLLSIGSLPETLTALKFSNLKPVFLEDLPRNLDNLKFDENQTSLPELPDGLKSLTYFGRLQAPLPLSLKSLTIRMDNQNIRFLAPLRALSQLELHGDVTRLPSNLASLESLDISQTEIHSLQGLPPSLTSLTLRPGQVKALEGLPKSVVSLHFRQP